MSNLKIKDEIEDSLSMRIFLKVINGDKITVEEKEKFISDCVIGLL